MTHTKCTDVDPLFDDAFMSEYFDGKTFVNLETGNFQGAENSKHEASEASYTAGKNIKAFRSGQATSQISKARIRP